MVPKKIDPRVVAILVAILIVGTMTMLGDRVAFVREPRNTVEWLLALPTGIFFQIIGERFYANLATAVLWTSLVLVGGVFLYGFVVRRVIEPMVIRNMIETKRREKELLNRYGDDTL